MRLRKQVFRGYRELRRRLLGIPRPGSVAWGDLRRLEPISRNFGTDRGLPIDRYYIERFLADRAADVRGRVLEIGNDVYARRFGAERITACDILHVDQGNPKATIIADLSDAPQIPDSLFDCVILTQTLHLIYDVRAALRTLCRILRPGGVLLLTVPGITPVPTGSQWGHTWHWAFTPLSIGVALRETFGTEDVAIGVHGNVLAATAFLQGLAVEELATDELDSTDPDYPVIVTGWARKDGP